MAEIGFIYILEHDAGNMVKVGETSRSPKLRGNEYIKQYQLKNFTLKKEYKVPLNARRDVEKRAHKKLDKFQLSSAATGGAREIFNCSLSIAQTAVEEAIAESEIAKFEAEKQRLRELERQRKAKATAKMDAELEAFTLEWLKDWETSDWFNTRDSKYKEFVASNSFEKSGKRSFGDYLVLSFGWYCLLCGIGLCFGLIRHLFDPIPNNNYVSTILLLAGVSAALIWVGRMFISYPILPVTDTDAIAEKKAMEDEIANEREIQKDSAKKSFHLRFSIEDFYD